MKKGWKYDDYIEGMRATSVEEKEGVLVFKGEYFLDDILIIFKS